VVSASISRSFSSVKPTVMRRHCGSP
jgi:hypothetical protein